MRTESLGGLDRQACEAHFFQCLSYHIKCAFFAFDFDCFPRSFPVKGHYIGREKLSYRLLATRTAAMDIRYSDYFSGWGRIRTTNATDKTAGSDGIRLKLAAESRPK